MADEGAWPKDSTYEQVGEEEGSELVGRHGDLQSVSSLLLAEGVGHAGVVDKHVQPALVLVDVFGERTDRAKRAQVQLLHDHVVVLRRVHDTFCNGHM